MRPDHPSFINQDLRRHSFRQQMLQNVHFSGCDLRGCDFYKADLRGARFFQCRTGYHPQRLAIAVVSVAIAAAFMLHAVSTLVFSAMGTLPNHAAWAYVVALYAALALAALSTLLTILPLPVTRIAQSSVGLSTAALMGFFYGGSLTDNSPAFAVTGAIGLGLVGGLLAWCVRSPLFNAMVGLLGAIATYGLAIVLWVSGSDLLTTGTWAGGSAMAAVATFWVGVTFGSLAYSWRSLKRHATTSFHYADLRGCTFAATDIDCCDLAKAIR